MGDGIAEPRGLFGRIGRIAAGWLCFFVIDRGQTVQVLPQVYQRPKHQPLTRARVVERRAPAAVGHPPEA